MYEAFVILGARKLPGGIRHWQPLGPRLFSDQQQALAKAKAGELVAMYAGQELRPLRLRGQSCPALLRFLAVMMRPGHERRWSGLMTTLPDQPIFELSIDDPATRLHASRLPSAESGLRQEGIVEGVISETGVESPSGGSASRVKLTDGHEALLPDDELLWVTGPCDASGLRSLIWFDDMDEHVPSWVTIGSRGGLVPPPEAVEQHRRRLLTTLAAGPVRLAVKSLYGGASIIVSRRDIMVHPVFPLLDVLERAPRTQLHGTACEVKGDVARVIVDLAADDRFAGCGLDAVALMEGPVFRATTKGQAWEKLGARAGLELAVAVLSPHAYSPVFVRWGWKPKFRSSVSVAMGSSRWVHFSPLERELARVVHPCPECGTPIAHGSLITWMLNHGDGGALDFWSSMTPACCRQNTVIPLAEVAPTFAWHLTMLKAYHPMLGSKLASIAPEGDR